MAEADIQAPRGDVLIPFLFEGQAVRGAIVSIDSGIEEMFGARDYPPALRTLVAQASAAMPLLATHLKNEGKINLQFQGSGDLSLLVAQVDHELTVRGTAKFDPEIRGSFSELLADGTLALMLEPRSGRQHYQAVVPVVGDGLADALEGYFRQSEQLDTRLLIAVSDHRLTGLLVQRLPAEDDAGEDVAAYWEHVSALVDTLGEAELAREPASTILHRLFHGENLRVFEPRAVTLRCQCSHASISGMLVSLGRDELQPVLDERGEVEVTCEFCGRSYKYSPAEIETLLNGAEAEPDDGPTH